MQPYFFPYIGYFQLISAVDKFIFYDDVNYIKGGWINRNTLRINGERHYITLRLSKASSFKRINDIRIESKEDKLLKTIKQAYVKAPYYSEVIGLIEELFEKIIPGAVVSSVAGLSVILVSNYLGLKKEFEYSSNRYPINQNNNLEKAKRIISICHINESTVYINSIGGVKLYSKKEFLDNGINLYFLKSQINQNRQENYSFIPNLSIIDVLMHNSKEVVNKLILNYNLI